MQSTIKRSFTCACQRAGQFPVFATLQRRRTLPALLLEASFALEATRGIGCRGQLKTRSGLTRVAGTTLHASGKLSVCRALELCGDMAGVFGCQAF